MDTVQRSQTHNTFVIERDFDAPVAKVWHALSDDAARSKWFGAGDAFETSERSHDFRVGGHGVEDGKWHDGPRSRYTYTYTDIVDQERIVHTYDMWVDGAHMSTSLSTTVLEPHGDGTRMTYTEQGVHLDGLDEPAQREAGTIGLFEQLADYLTA